MSVLQLSSTNETRTVSPRIIAIANQKGGILLYHVAPGGQTVRQLDFLRPVETLNGQNVRLFFNRVIDANFATADARIISPSDLQASNGVIQTVDRVLRPS